MIKETYEALLNYLESKKNELGVKKILRDVQPITETPVLVVAIDSINLERNATELALRLVIYAEKIKENNTIDNELANLTTLDALLSVLSTLKLAVEGRSVFVRGLKDGGVIRRVIRGNIVSYQFSVTLTAR